MFKKLKETISYLLLLKDTKEDNVNFFCFFKNTLFILLFYVILFGIIFEYPINITYSVGAFIFFILMFSLKIIFPYRKRSCFIRTRIFLTTISTILMFFVLIIKFLNSPIFRAKDYATYLPIKQVKIQDIITDKPSQIRKVTKEMAIMKANKIIGREIDGVQLSTQYRLSTPSIIKYKNKQYWIFPLEYAGIFKWIANKNIPGYILVDATEPYKDPIFVKKPYKITTNYLNTNINLIAQFLTDFSPNYIHFEIDEKGNPYWIVTKYGYGILFNLYNVSKVYAINALTGKVENVLDNNKQIKKNLRWIDKIIGEEVNREYIENYGKYLKGFLNYLFTEKNVNIPSTDDLWLIETKKEGLGWFTGMTSTSNEDNSLNYMVVVKANSPHPTLYVIQNIQGVTDENGAIEAINNELGANSIKWEAKLAMPFIINKNFYWIASIVSYNGYYVKEGAVKGDNITEVYIENSLEEIIKRIISNSSFTSIQNNIQRKYTKKEMLEEIKKIEDELNKLKRMINAQ